MKSIRLLFFITSLVFVIIASSCNSSKKNPQSASDTLKGKISISGAFALYPMTIRWAEEFKKIHPAVAIDISAGGAGKGMTDALTKMIDLGMYSKEVSMAEAQKGAWWIAVVKDAVVPTINSKHPSIKLIKEKGLTKDQFYQIFITGRTKNWRQITGNSTQKDIHVYTRSDACGASEMWAKYLNGKKQEDILGIGVNGDPGVADAVRKDIFGIGYNNINYAYDMQTRKMYEGIEVIPIDINENGKIDTEENFYNTLDDLMHAIKAGKYPSPPARELYFVSAGKPSKAPVIEFLKWVLNEGQKYVDEAGYVTLPSDKIQLELQKLN